jgi:hypothetical protein
MKQKEYIVIEKSELCVDVRGGGGGGVGGNDDARMVVGGARCSPTNGSDKAGQCDDCNFHFRSS